MKNNKGITLVSLIITIIVMVILAGIALLFTVGEDGIIERTTQATKKSHESENEEKIELVISSYSIESYEAESINYKKIVNEILDIFHYPNINEEDGTLLEGETGITDLYTMTAEEGLVNIVSKSQELLLRIKYNEEIKTIKIEYNNKIWEFENLKLKSKEKNTYVEYNAPEEIAGTEYKSGLWQYKKNESGTLTITQYLGTTAEELTDVAVPNRINGQVVEYFDGFGKNLTGTLTISKGLKTIKNQLGNRTLANLKVNKLILGEEVIIESGYFLINSIIKEIEIKDNVILNADAIFAGIKPDVINIGNNVQILYNGFIWCSSKQVNIGNNCIVKGEIPTEKLIIGDNVDINIAASSSLKELVIGKNAIMNGFSGATSLANVIVGENINLVGENLFQNCISFTDEIVNNIFSKTSKNIQVFGLFRGCTKLKNIIIPSDRIITRKSKPGEEQYLFTGCNIESIVVGDNCVVNGNAFAHIKTMTNVTIGNNVKFNGGYAFSSCELLENVTIGENCIFSDAEFNNNNNMKNIIIGKGTRGWATFWNSKGIENIIYYLTDEQINSCKQDINNVNKIVNSENMLTSAIQGNSTLTATFEEDKIVLKKVES